MSSACPHCGQPVDAAEAQAPFCCVGCRAARAIVESEGWTQFYDLRGPEGRAGVEGFIGGEAPAWLAAAVSDAESRARGLCELDVAVNGMHCAACAWVVDKAAKRAGAAEAPASVARGRATIRWTPGELDLEKLSAPLSALGYQLAPPEARRRASHGLTARLGVVAALAMNAMVLAAARYFGMGGDEGALFDALSALLMVIAVAVSGGVFARGAWQAVKLGRASMDLPITVGVALAAGGSLATLKWPALEVAYFDTVTIFLALVLFGRWLQARVVEQGRALVADAPELAQTQVRVRVGENTEVRRAGQLAAGDRLVLAPGEVALTRGALRSENAALSLEWTTGEPEPRGYTAGDEVPAGARNRGATPVELVVVEPVSASSIARLFAAEERGDNALGGRAVKLVVRHYAPFVLALAALGFALWARTDLGAALEVAVAILVVTCPCALGLALPMAYELAAQSARRAGVFVRRLDVFDRLGRVRRVALDKTGTLTLGDLAVEDDLSALSGEARAALVALAAGSNHPRSRALVAALVEVEAASASVEETAGQGVRANIAGAEWRLGRARFAAAAEDDGRAWLTKDGARIAAFTFHERARPAAAHEIEALRSAGLEVEVISGDHPDRVRAFSAALGVDAAHAHGGMTPEAKAAHVAAGDTLVLGDGLNDALALDAALVAGSPGLEVPTVPGRCDLVVTTRRFPPLASLVDLSARLRRATNRALVVALTYNAAVVAVSLSGHMNPLLAALLMPLSSVAVVLMTRAALNPARAARARSLSLAEVNS
jgi:Cu2+-exporting ATPase